MAPPLPSDEQEQEEKLHASTLRVQSGGMDAQTADPFPVCRETFANEQADSEAVDVPDTVPSLLGGLIRMSGTESVTA